jgi:hypothetical protein
LYKYSFEKVKTAIKVKGLIERYREHKNVGLNKKTVNLLYVCLLEA